MTTQAQSSAAPPRRTDLTERLIVGTARFGNWLVTSYRAWRSRQELGQLQRFDDRMLKDIGVERADIDWARMQPWPTDATLALSERVERRRARVRMLRRLHRAAESSRS